MNERKNFLCKFYNVCAVAQYIRVPLGMLNSITILMVMTCLSVFRLRHPAMTSMSCLILCEWKGHDYFLILRFNENICRSIYVNEVS